MSINVLQSIPITETWQRSNWNNWTTDVSFTSGTIMGREPSSSQPWGLSTLNHIDIRDFSVDTWVASGGATVTPGSLAGSNHLPGGTVTFPSAQTYTVVSTATSLDLTSIDGNLIVTLPSFPLADISVANSTLDLSSDGFVSHISSVNWGASNPAAIAGNTVLQWPISALTGTANLAAITGVRLTVDVTTACTLTIMDIRLVDPNWVQSNITYDGRSDILRMETPANGDVTVAVPANQQMPIIWRSATVPGLNDPQPINGEYSVLFYTGSQTSINSFTLYLRGTDQAFLTQLDLEGETQAQLTGQPQPEYGVSEYSPRTLGDLVGRPLSEIDGTSMLNLERVVNPQYDSWISFQIVWGTYPSIRITNSANPGGGYNYTGMSYTDFYTYAAIINLTDGAARVQIYAMGDGQDLEQVVFDTQVINDPFTFQRQAGRVGFNANFGDGDSWVGDIRPRSLMFAEYRSRALESITPVRGARLFVNPSPDIELFDQWQPLADSNHVEPTLGVSHQRYLNTDSSRESTQITVQTPSTVSPAQGITTSTLTPAGDAISGITNFGQLHIEFGVWMPAAAIASTTSSVLTAALISPHNVSYPVTLPTMLPNQWTSVSLLAPLAPPYPLSGLWSFQVYYNGTIPTQFWIDGVSIHQHRTEFDARSIVSDPWGANDAPWTLFHDTLNSDTSGVLFSKIGTNLQMRARALAQDAYILGPPQLIPIYAELGRLVWPENAPVLGLPTVTFSTSNAARDFTFNGTGSSSPNGEILNYVWAFGDGTYGTGPIVSHLYSAYVLTGTTYPVTLTVTDVSGTTVTGTPNIVTMP